MTAMKLGFVHIIRATAFFALVGAAACSDSPTAVDTTTNTGSNSPTNTAAVPVSIAALAGASQNATVGSAVAVYPQVIVKDASGSPVSAVTVTFTVTSGGGAVQNTTAITNAQGVASAGNWTLGNNVGANTLQASVSALPPVVFTANAVGTYHITIRYTSSITARQQQAVEAAVNRWQTVIVNDLVDIPLNAPANSCFTGQPALNERIDDIVIYVEFVKIDGAGQILGEAGPCYIRNDNKLPVLGHLKLDTDDLAQMERIGTIDDVVLHEIGHILGIGTMWTDKGLLTGAGTNDPRFTGFNAIGAYRALGGLDAAVAVENTGSTGTRDGHWRESTFGNELMTGYISGTGNPMSSMTIASLADLGYGTNSGAASTFTLSRVIAGVQSGVELEGHERIVRPKFKVDRHGNKTQL
jgi:hypothetical protein